MQGRAPPLVGDVNGGAASHQRLQTLIVTTGGGVVKRSPEEEQRESGSTRLFNKSNSTMYILSNQINDHLMSNVIL